MPIPFPYTPLRGARKSVKWQVAELNMGSGYSVATALGRTVTWELEFIADSICVDKDELIGKFLEAGAVDTLLWTPPNHDPHEFVVEQWDMKPERNGVYRISATFRLVENEVLSGGNQPDPCPNPDYTLSFQPYIRTLDLTAQYGSTQATKVRRTSLRFANQYEQRNYDDRLRSVFESWSIQVRAMTYSEAIELDEFLNSHRGEDLFKWDDHECVPAPGEGGGSASPGEGDGSGSHADHFYRCGEWSLEFIVGADGECEGHANFQATFEQRYGIYVGDILSGGPDCGDPVFVTTHNFKAIWTSKEIEVA